jgi:hypothetical protein
MIIMRAEADLDWSINLQDHSQDCYDFGIVGYVSKQQL